MPESSSQHTFYVLANRTIDGISHRERLKLALVSSYKGKLLLGNMLLLLKSG